VGELNGDRSNLPYGTVAGEEREYGACDFAIGGKPRVAQPPEGVRGDAARIWLYMADTYEIKMTAEQRKLFQAWSNIDPPDDWERLRENASRQVRAITIGSSHRRLVGPRFNRVLGSPAATERRKAPVRWRFSRDLPA
jgi:endonuclease I